MRIEMEKKIFLDGSDKSDQTTENKNDSLKVVRLDI